MRLLRTCIFQSVMDSYISHTVITWFLLSYKYNSIITLKEDAVFGNIASEHLHIRSKTGTGRECIMGKWDRQRWNAFDFCFPGSIKGPSKQRSLWINPVRRYESSHLTQNSTLWRCFKFSSCSRIGISP